MGEGGFHSSRSEVERRVRSSPSKNKFRRRRKFDRGLRSGGSKPRPTGWCADGMLVGDGDLTRRASSAPSPTGEGLLKLLLLGNSRRNALCFSAVFC